MNNTIENYLGRHNLHIRITEVPEPAAFMQDVRRWIYSEDKIITCLGSLEQGEAGNKHWQLTTTCKVAHGAMRNCLKSAFPQLAGVRGQKGVTYYIKPVKDWNSSCSYCLKSYPVVKEDNNIIIKGMDLATAQAIPQWITPTGGNKSFINMLTEHVKVHAKNNSRQQIGISILRYFLEHKKVLPNKWKLRDYIVTVEMMIEENTENMLEDLVTEALSL